MAACESIGDGMKVLCQVRERVAEVGELDEARTRTSGACSAWEGHSSERVRSIGKRTYFLLVQLVLLLLLQDAHPTC